MVKWTPQVLWHHRSTWKHLLFSLTAIHLRHIMAWRHDQTYQQCLSHCEDVRPEKFDSGLVQGCWLHHPSKLVLWIKEIPQRNKFGQLTEQGQRPNQISLFATKLLCTWAQLVVDCICRWSAISSLIQESYRLSEMYFGNALKENCLTTHTFRSVLSPRPSVTSLISDSFLLLTDRKGWFHHVQPLLHSSFPNFHRGHHQNTTLLCRDKSL